MYSLTTGGWEELPRAPLTGRYDPLLIPYNNTVFVYGGEVQSGQGHVQDAAFLDLATRSWTPAVAPEVRSLVAVVEGELLSFGSSGVHSFNQEQETWNHIATGPDRLSEPDVVTVNDAGKVVVIQVPYVWRYDYASAGFEVVGDVPVAHATAAGASEIGVVVWDESEGRLAVLLDGANDWIAAEGPDFFFDEREGTALCVGSTWITIWGGWRIRENVIIASDTGASIAVADLVSQG